MQQNRLKKISQYLKKDGLLYIMLIIPISYYIIFQYIPMYGVSIAFKDYNPFKGIMASAWIGFDVFKDIFKMAEFYRALRNTVMLNLINLVFGFPIPIILAIMINEVRKAKIKKGIQTILYLPHFISWVIIGGIVYQLFATDSGIINYLLSSMGMGKIPFLTNNYLWILIYFFTGVWQSAGWGAIIYLAAITGIDSQIYEAATIDGCSRYKMIWNITLPSIKPTIVIMLILNIGKIMSIGFDQPLMLGNPLVQDVADVISTFVYRIGIQSSKYSIATAIGLFQSIISLIMIGISNFVANKLGEEGLY